MKQNSDIKPSHLYNQKDGELIPAIKVTLPPSTTKPDKERIEVYYHQPNVPHTEKDVIQFFQEKIGLVRTFDSMFNNGTVRTKITFTNPTDARKALLVLDGTPLLGNQMTIKLYIGDHLIEREQVPSWYINTLNAPPILQAASPSPPNEKCVFVVNLPYGTTVAEIKTLFEELGPVESVELKLDDHGFYKGQAKVVFRDSSHARKALDYNNSIFHGRTIRVRPYTERKKLQPAINKGTELPSPQGQERIEAYYNLPHAQYISQYAIEYFQEKIGPVSVFESKALIDLDDEMLLGSEIELFMDECRILREEVLRNNENEVIPCDPCVLIEQPEYEPPLSIMEQPNDSNKLVKNCENSILPEQLADIPYEHLNCDDNIHQLSFIQPDFVLPPNTTDQEDRFIVVSNLPDTVYISNFPFFPSTEIKDYFEALVGNVKSVDLEQNEHGSYNGNVKMVFHDPSNARKALICNGFLVQGNKIQMTLNTQTNKGSSSDPQANCIPKHLASIPYEHLNCDDNVHQLNFIQPDFVLPPNATDKDDEFIVVSNVPDLDYESIILPKDLASIPYEHLNCDDNVHQLNSNQPDFVLPPNATDKDDEFIVVSNVPDLDYESIILPKDLASIPYEHLNCDDNVRQLNFNQTDFVLPPKATDKDDECIVVSNLKDNVFISNKTDKKEHEANHLLTSGKRLIKWCTKIASPFVRLSNFCKTI